MVFEKLVPRRLKGKIAEKVSAKIIQEKVRQGEFIAVELNKRVQAKKYYDAIKKAKRGKSLSKKDARFWEKTRKALHKNIVGKPNEATLFYRQWLESFPQRVRENKMTKQDKENLGLFRDYIKDSVEHAQELYYTKKLQGGK